MEKLEEKVVEVLEKLGIGYEKIEHPPVFTCEEMAIYMNNVTGIQCKNLFLRNKKGNRHFLVVLEESKSMNIKEFGKQIGVSNLSFGSADRLLKYLGLTPGAVSPFGLMNDENHEVEVYIDSDVFESGEVNFHPNVNTATYHLTIDGFKKFLDWSGNKVSTFVLGLI